jgi:hypothetical protein
VGQIQKTAIFAWKLSIIFNNNLEKKQETKKSGTKVGKKWARSGQKVGQKEDKNPPILV